MSVRTAEAQWKGDLPGGSGTVRSESGTVEASYTAGQRFGEDPGTNPEELLGAAHAACFAMALANVLAEAGHDPKQIDATAHVHLDMGEDGPAVSRIVLECEGRVGGIDAEGFQEKADAAKSGCPISRALAATPITLEARLLD